MVNHLDVTRVFLAVIFKDNQNSDEIVELCLVSTKTNKQDIQQDIEFAEIWISPLWWDLLARFKKYLHFLHRTAGLLASTISSWLVITICHWWSLMVIIIMYFSSVFPYWHTLHADTVKHTKDSMPARPERNDAFSICYHSHTLTFCTLFPRIPANSSLQKQRIPYSPVLGDSWIKVVQFGLKTSRQGSCPLRLRGGWRDGKMCSMPINI